MKHAYRNVLPMTSSLDTFHAKQTFINMFKSDQHLEGQLREETVTLSISALDTHE
jgi:hypothetical protein